MVHLGLLGSLAKPFHVSVVRGSTTTGQYSMLEAGVSLLLMRAVDLSGSNAACIVFMDMVMPSDLIHGSFWCLSNSLEHSFTKPSQVSGIRESMIHHYRSITHVGRGASSVAVGLQGGNKLWHPFHGQGDAY